MIKSISVFILLIILINCSNQTIYSGKILNEESFEDINFKDKNNLVSKLGEPSFVDPISKKYFYYSEKKMKKSIFNKKTNYSYVFIFEFDKNNIIINSKVFDLKNKQTVKLIEDETSNEIIKRGIIERIFGGVGPNQSLPTSP